MYLLMSSFKKVKTCFTIFKLKYNIYILYNKNIPTIISNRLKEKINKKNSTLEIESREAFQ